MSKRCKNCGFVTIKPIDVNHQASFLSGFARGYADGLDDGYDIEAGERPPLVVWSIVVGMTLAVCSLMAGIYLG